MIKHLCSLIQERAPANAGDARVTISTIDEDREGDVLVPEGAITEGFNRSPSVLFGHDHYALPVGRAVHLQVQPGKGIRADWVWLKGDPMADRVRNAWDQGVLNAASVGFLPRKWEPHGKTGRRYTEWELLEFSIVSVPANPQAVRTLKSLRLDGPAPLARATVLLDTLTDALKSGRVLSRANDERLVQASSLLHDILTHDDEDHAEQDKALPITVAGDTISVSEATLDRAIRRFVSDEIDRATGRVPEPAVLFADEDEESVIEMSDEELAALIEEALRDGIARGITRITGRLD
jgi:HK97 family phage prohead protease